VSKPAPQPDPDSKLIYRLKELQTKLSMSRNTIEGLIATGELKPPILLGPRSKGFLASDVDAFLEGRAAQRDASARPARPCAR
jgi:predicted DNA-binding transcriptional regulator AlpA